MKKNAFSLCLAGTVLFGTVTTPALALSVDKLTDVSQNDWFYPYVQSVAEKEYMVGVAENTFAPNMQVTRAMFVTTLAALDGAGTSTAKTPFTDVSSNAWYTNAVKWAYANGIVAGISATEFAPNAVISREQMCVMMSAFLNYRANKDDVTFKTTVDEKTFPDAASISTWAKDAVKKSQMWGLVAGDENGNMNPRKAATRAEAAVMLKQLDAVLAAGISNGGSSGGGGGSSSSKTADYTVKVTVSVPDGISTTDLELLASYDNVKIKGSNVTGDKTLGQIAQDLTTGENETAITNAVDAAMKQVKGKSVTRTVNGQTVTVTVSNDGVVSASVAMKVTDLTGGVTRVSQADVESLIEKLQAGGSIEFTATDVEALDKLLEKMDELDGMTDAEIQEKMDEYVAGNPALEQAVAGMTVDAVRDAAASYQTQLEDIKRVVEETPAGEPIETEPVMMDVAMDLGVYLEKASNAFAARKDAVISRLEQEVGIVLTEAQKEKAEAVYDLSDPSRYVVDKQDGTLAMKGAAEYTALAQEYVTAVTAFYESMGDQSAQFYQDMMDRVMNKFGDEYGISYENTSALADLLADEDGIFVDTDNNFRSDVTASVTVEANDTTYGSWVDLITGRFDQAESILPDLLPGRLMGNYTVTLTIDKQ